MKFTDICLGTKEFVHILLPNLRHWEKQLTLNLVKEKSMVCISSGPVGLWHETGQDGQCEDV